MKRTGAITILGIGLTAACAHPIVVQSVPAGAELAPVETSGKAGPSLGKAPQTVGPGIFELSAPGYLSKRVIIPQQSGYQGEISVALQPADKQWFENELRSHNAEVLSDALTELIRLQTAILRDQDVLIQYEKLKKPYDSVSVFHSMMGNYHFLKGDVAKAKFFYKRSLELNPKNDEARRMLKLVETRRP